jgi:hypothetical protein
MAYIYNPRLSGDRDWEDGGLKPVWANSSLGPISQNTQPQNRPGRVAQVVEGPPSKHEALSSNSSTELV